MDSRRNSPRGAPLSATCSSAIFIPLTASEYSKKIKFLQNTLSFAAQPLSPDMSPCSAPRRAVSSPVHEGLVMAQNVSRSPGELYLNAKVRMASSLELMYLKACEMEQLMGLAKVSEDVVHADLLCS
ncbi:hypothetical protein CDAR_297431 [Caerostris darwini]|uniref:Uncharacterized protein n=1 Tax=Caerostris darwini TaxID=1538125 RepID=A0AAV4TXR4_9ARAC|nr:hypothetical protein CDAR_297431 [Caerostris darwini]